MIRSHWYIVLPVKSACRERFFRWAAERSERAFAGWVYDSRLIGIDALTPSYTDTVTVCGFDDPQEAAAALARMRKAVRRQRLAEGP